MKCHKCYAENINEAVKCGICGVRLKYIKPFDGFTGRQRTQPSSRHDTQEQQIFKQDSNIKPNTDLHSSQNQSLSSNRDQKAEKKIRKLWISVQERTLRAQGQYVENPLKNKKVFLYIVWVLIIFVMAIIDGIKNNSIS